jgi:ketose-bisphosphate aldolase
MSLEPVGDLMGRARRKGYAVGYFESWSIDSLYGVVDAAEALRSPVIIGFNGEFLSHSGRTAEERVSLYGALGKAAAEAASVPCGFIFNECAQDDWTKAAVGAGFNLVMPADAAASFDGYARRVAEITAFAHRADVAVEAEIGELPSGAPGEDNHTGSHTEASQARDFVEKTGIDLLAVSVGNVHIALRGEYDLDLERLKAIRESVDVPLVLHGGTGIAAGPLKAAIALGVTKINFGTYVKQRYIEAVRRAFAVDVRNPHEMLGLGGEHDVLVVGRKAVRDAVLERMPLLGSAGQA